MNSIIICQKQYITISQNGYSAPCYKQFRYFEVPLATPTKYLIKQQHLLKWKKIKAKKHLY